MARTLAPVVFGATGRPAPVPGGREGVFQLETSWQQGDAADSALAARRQRIDATPDLAYRF